MQLKTINVGKTVDSSHKAIWDLMLIYKQMKYDSPWG